jgi:hypothetical protein
MYRLFQSSRLLFPLCQQSRHLLLHTLQLLHQSCRNYLLLSTHQLLPLEQTLQWLVLNVRSTRIHLLLT